jgi:hypothetical protein
MRERKTEAKRRGGRGRERVLEEKNVEIEQAKTKGTKQRDRMKRQEAKRAKRS